MHILRYNLEMDNLLLEQEGSEKAKVTIYLLNMSGFPQLWFQSNKWVSKKLIVKIDPIQIFVC